MSSNPVMVPDAPKGEIYPSAAARLQIFSTCPSSLATPDKYFERVAQVARWSEQAGCTGVLIYTDNSLVDPWLVAHTVIQSTSTLCPLVAVQPVYMHPYAAAKMVASLGFLHGRRVYLNMVAGGFKNDLTALNDTTPHDSRYARLIEYTLIIKRLLESRTPVTFEGEFYRVRGLSMSPRLAPELLPGILVSGSSEAGMAAALEMGAVAVKYPEPPRGTSPLDACTPCGIRIGVIARRREEEAWQVAYQRFPDDRRGQITRQIATKISDSSWHKRLSEIGGADHGSEAYWLHPFENYQTNCPYLVGSYDVVASELARYIAAGYRTYILDIPAAEEEFEHIGIAFQRASHRAAA